ncbi:MAG: bifunctional adenosylcobinamide kinase/adenosylcobinamide-phosphate guanylyltransferase [Deltaproteobacteria bacterium]|nr:bifunctional adenosylcobinamide kinase/adenosylcobinamide-phosphate guanylyltransferase [Deltaproteobacteria bacterium]
MSRTIFITGGARSGKSRLAEKLAAGFGEPLCYIATGEARDGEMAERIASHRQRRGAAWQTVEEPLRLLDAIRTANGHYQAILVDCVTLWITNLLFYYDAVEPVLAEVRTLAEILPTLNTPLILVSNEVGMGIVPENALARSFRDLAGNTNQLLAKAADEVYVTFSGIPLQLK